MNEMVQYAKVIEKAWKKNVGIEMMAERLDENEVKTSEQIQQQ